MQQCWPASAETQLARTGLHQLQQQAHCPESRTHTHCSFDHTLHNYPALQHNERRNAKSHMGALSTACAELIISLLACCQAHNLSTAQCSVGCDLRRCLHANYFMNGVGMKQDFMEAVGKVGVLQRNLAVGTSWHK